MCIFGFGREDGPLVFLYLKNNIDPECDEEPCNQDDQPREINQSIAVRRRFRTEAVQADYTITTNIHNIFIFIAHQNTFVTGSPSHSI